MWVVTSSMWAVIGAAWAVTVKEHLFSGKISLIINELISMQFLADE